MRLTNKQLSLIANMIHKRIYTKEYYAEQKVAKDLYITKHSKDFYWSELFHQIKMILELKSVQYVSILSKDLCTAIEVLQDNTIHYYNENSNECFYKLEDVDKYIAKVLWKELDYRKGKPTLSIEQIENEIVLSMLHTKDIDQLIEKVTERLTA